jgi:hypothetical protein
MFVPKKLPLFCYHNNHSFLIKKSLYVDDFLKKNKLLDTDLSYICKIQKLYGSKKGTFLKTSNIITPLKKELLDKINYLSEDTCRLSNNTGLGINYFIVNESNTLITKDNLLSTIQKDDTNYMYLFMNSVK